MRIKSTFNRLKNGYIHFVEKQGFAIIAVVCVGVITATAVWSRQEEVYVAPTPPVSHDVSAAQLQQQSLRDVVTPSPAPTVKILPWSAPMENIKLLRPFDADTMLQSGVTGIWAIHDAVDIASSNGEKVFAIRDGVVVDSGDDALLGTWLLIDHGEGYEALYAGLALSADYRPSDKVFDGDVIGYAGKGPLDETDLGPHLHLRVTQDGRAIDPMPLWDGNAK